MYVANFGMYIPNFGMYVPNFATYIPKFGMEITYRGKNIFFGSCRKYSRLEEKINTIYFVLRSLIRIFAIKIVCIK